MLGIWVLDKRDLCVACAVPSEVLLGRVPVGEHNTKPNKGLWPLCYDVARRSFTSTLELNYPNRKFLV
jgi:hypothetical protein